VCNAVARSDVQPGHHFPALLPALSRFTRSCVATVLMDLTDEDIFGIFSGILKLRAEF
jgi:hypothetical protein